MRKALGLESVFLRNFSDSEPHLNETIQKCLDMLANAISMQVRYSSVPDTWLPFQTLESLTPAPQKSTYTHISYPIKSLSGDQIGALICGSDTAKREISPSEERLVAATGRFIASHILLVAKITRPQSDLERDLVQTLVTNRFSQAFQPIRRLSDLSTAGFEALTRFPDLKGVDTLQAFNAARRFGFGSQFDIHAAMQIVGNTRDTVRERGFIAFNASNQTLMLNAITTLYEWGCDGLPGEGYIIEISEQDAVENFGALRERLVEMRALGLKLAIDDVGAGQTGLQHILRLEPDMIKIDRSVTAGIVDHKTSRAMLSALTRFGAQTDCDIVCEGVETEAELAILRDLDVPFAQGYLLGRPAPLPELVTAA